MDNPPDFIHLFFRQFWRILKMDYPLVWKQPLLNFLANIPITLNEFVPWYLTIIPQARIDSESIAHEAEGRR